MKVLNIAITTTLLLLFSGMVNAQDSRRAKKSYEKKPKSILVQLPLYQNRIDILKENRDTELLTKLMNDKDSMILKMISDFSDNFHYCPVYYFLDTNFNRISEGNFTNVFLDKDLKHIEPNIKPGDDYFLVTFSYPVPGPGDTDSKGVAPTTFNVVRTNQKLVVMNNKLRLVKKPDLNSQNFIYQKNMSLPWETYRYQSKNFDIYYRPYAKDLEVRLVRYYK